MADYPWNPHTQYTTGKSTAKLFLVDITGNPFVKSYEPTVNGLSIYKATIIQATTLIQIECELLSVESEQAILLNALIVYYFNETVNQSHY